MERQDAIGPVPSIGEQRIRRTISAPPMTLITKRAIVNPVGSSLQKIMAGSMTMTIKSRSMTNRAGVRLHTPCGINCRTNQGRAGDPTLVTLAA